MNTPAILNLPDHYRGDWFDTLTFEVLDQDVPDLTTCVIAMQLKLPNSEKVVKTFDVPGAGLEIVDATHFRIVGQRVTVPAATYVFDIEVTPANGQTVTYIKGNWKIVQDVTNSTL